MFPRHPLKEFRWRFTSRNMGCEANPILTFEQMSNMFSLVSNIKACNTSQGIKILFTQCSHKLLLSLLAVVTEQMEILYWEQPNFGNGSQIANSWVRIGYKYPLYYSQSSVFAEELVSSKAVAFLGQASSNTTQKWDSSNFDSLIWNSICDWVKVQSTGISPWILDIEFIHAPSNKFLNMFICR